MHQRLHDHPVTKRWPPAHPDRLQLYSLPTPNGVKIPIMLEETGLPYEVHRVDFGKGEQRSSEYLSLNPNGKIPAIIDPDGPGGRPLPLFESGAIGHIGPMFGQLGFFVKFEGREWNDKRALERFAKESRRLLGVMDQHLAGREWFVADEFTIADISMIGMVRNLVEFYGAGELVGYRDFRNVDAWLKRGLDRPAVQKGLKIPAQPGS